MLGPGMAKHFKSNPHRSLCRLLRQARLAAGVTQAQVARRLGRPQSWVSEIETANRRIDLIEFLKYADAIGVSPYELIREFRGVRRGG